MLGSTCSSASPCPWQPRDRSLTNAAPRGPKPPSPGEPSLAVPLLAGAAGEVVDGAALAYLLQQSLAVKNKKEEVRM